MNACRQAQLSPCPPGQSRGKARILVDVLPLPEEKQLLLAQAPHVDAPQPDMLAQVEVTGPSRATVSNSKSGEAAAGQPQLPAAATVELPPPRSRLPGYLNVALQPQQPSSGVIGGVATSSCAAAQSSTWLQQAIVRCAHR